MRGGVLIALLLLFLQVVSTDQSALAAGPDPASSSLPSDPDNTLYLDLDYGRVVIRMRPDLAPKHVARIKHLVRERFYDGTVFHRVISGFMAQTGDPSGTGAGGSGRSIDAEFTRTPQVRGTVSMARTSDKNSADSQWFIVLADSRAALDGKYTVWGEVTSGMEFVDMIHKGDADNNGKVRNPDRIVRLQVAADADGIADNAAESAAAPADFSAAEFRCIALTDNSSTTSQSVLARLWTHGYLAGTYKATNKLIFFADAAGGPADIGLSDACRTYPQSFLPTVVNQTLTQTPRELPATTAAFSPATYTCANYIAARNGANVAEADMAGLWGFAFIQGFKNVSQPNMEIPFDVRARLLGAVASVCAKNPDMGFLDATALLAGKVKLK
ncbi:MAG: peptidylprolyl isomerase [Rhodospirillaceae bacterium]|nr:MAG: peptidylprolyl isomerase [Rhodospirillaceae bacterium]